MLAEGAAVDVRESGDGRPTLALITYCTYLADHGAHDDGRVTQGSRARRFSRLRGALSNAADRYCGHGGVVEDVLEGQRERAALEGVHVSGWRG